MLQCPWGNVKIQLLQTRTCWVVTELTFAGKELDETVLILARGTGTGLIRLSPAIDSEMTERGGDQSGGGGWCTCLGCSVSTRAESMQLVDLAIEQLSVTGGRLVKIVDEAESLCGQGFAV